MKLLYQWLQKSIQKEFAHKITVFILILFALLLRLPKLDQSIWHDEAYSIYVSSQPISALPHLLARDNGAPLHYYLLHGWIQLFGDSETATRALSVLIGMAVVILLGSMAKTLFGRKGQLLALLLVAIGPLAVYYAQEARPYALAQLLTLLSASLLIKIVKQSDSKYYYLLGMTNGLLVLTHYWGIFVVFAELLTLLVLRIKSYKKLLLVSLPITVLFLLPWIPIFLRQLQQGPSLWLTIEKVWILPLRTVGLFVGGKFALVSIGIILLFQGKTICKKFTTIPVCIISIIILTTLLTAMVVSYYSPLYLVGRHDVLLYPMFLLVLVALLQSLSNQYLKIFFLVVLVVSFSSTTLASFQKLKSADKIVATYIQKNTTKNDTVIFTFLARTAFEYYNAKTEYPIPALSYPSYIDAHAGAVIPQELQKRTEENRRDVENLSEQCKKTIAMGYRCLMIYYDDHAVNPALLQKFQQTLGEPSTIDNIPERQTFYAETMYWWGTE